MAHTQDHALLTPENCTLESEPSWPMATPHSHRKTPSLRQRVPFLPFKYSLKKLPIAKAFGAPIAYRSEEPRIGKTRFPPQGSPHEGGGHTPPLSPQCTKRVQKLTFLFSQGRFPPPGTTGYEAGLPVLRSLRSAAVPPCSCGSASRRPACLRRPSERHGMCPNHLPRGAASHTPAPRRPP